MKFDRDIVIGLEIHVEAKLKTKLFCGCPREGNNEPNTRTCEICLGMPGSKPVLNKKALELGLKLCIALKSKIAKELVFSRKSYFYPDMAKNYQISQYELPLGSGGELKLKDGKKIGIVRAHIEEDPASLVHPAGMQKSSYVLVDYNRSGNCLFEIVTEPDIESAEQAREFMKELIRVLEYLEIFDSENCIIKADANASIKETGYVRVEIKNITGFKEIERALNYEIERQRKEFEEGKQIRMETRAWDSEMGVTFPLRSKESEEDYGYIIDPDLVRIDISDDMLKEAKNDMPELSTDKIEKFIRKHKIKKEDAEVLAAEKKLAELFEKVAEEINPALAAKWLRRELMRVLNYNKKELHEVEIDEKHMIDLLGLVEKRTITDKTAQKIMEKLIEKPFDVKEYVKNEGLEVLEDKGMIERFCKEAIAENSNVVEDFRNGNEKAFNFIVGQVMRKAKGKASPKEVNELLKKLI